MSKRDQVLIIEPPIELSFQGPFVTAVTSSMKLKNPSDKKVCFKIKTTAPKRYCVKPNSGVVDPTSEVQIAVSLQPFEYDPSEKNKHKFMVQSMFAPDGEIDQDKLWKDADSNEMMDSKLKCVFVMPAGAEQKYVPENKVPVKVYPELDKVELPVKSDGDMSDAVKEIKKLNEGLSQIRQENLLLKEETMRLKRIAAASEKPDASSYSSTTVAAVGPSGEGLSTLYIYAALAILIIGMILGKFFL
ncbi:vesicle-associated membrane protein-associated protein A isoform X2 [Eurytemora carolleeae]|uniref:vesicle-associated membrane protein-associated protein A isoform X2 n=1 Tax=Eurytemora carolleeae TaxID=1294199 RepID=UPI000C76342E|nr:vesicle-associated membrane protein-associated protein A isoform X2 [Eurytemora carolleeae]|eukprot:XP_023331182.1 vesicle-associated membrane protein-associated protein A-like isoform X2 [Eurytemora affinis]